MTHYIPPPYLLNFYNHSISTDPLYHFRSDWEDIHTGSWDPHDPDANFTALDGTIAQVGDRVKSWRNAYGEGSNAYGPGGRENKQCPTPFEFIPYPQPPAYPQIRQLPCDGGNWWGEKGYPTLVSRSYQGSNQEYKGLKFTGIEYMQIDGAILKNSLGITDPLFTTGGSETMTGSYKNSGASFLFVIDPDPAIPGTLEASQGGPQGIFPGVPQDIYHPDTLYASNWEVMLYSRQPGFQGAYPAPDGHLGIDDPITCGACGCPTPLCPPYCSGGYPVYHGNQTFAFHSPYSSTSMMWPHDSWPPHSEDMDNPESWHALHNDPCYTWPETEANGVQLTRHYRQAYEAFGSANPENNGCNGRHHHLTWGPTGWKNNLICYLYDPLLNSLPWGNISYCSDYSWYTMGGWSETCDPPCPVQGTATELNPNKGHLATGTVQGGTTWPVWYTETWHSDASNPNKCDSTIYSGPQVILLEYDNTDHVDWRCGMEPVTQWAGNPIDSCCELNSLGNDVHTLYIWSQDYIGPRVKVYGLGNNLPPTDQPNTFCGYSEGLVGPRWGSDLSVPTIVTDVPTLTNHVLFDDKNIFLGGIPPVRPVHVDPKITESINSPAYFVPMIEYCKNKFGNGMRGVLYEFMMFEGKLSDADKVQLGNILKAKYSFLQ